MKRAVFLVWLLMAGVALAQDGGQSSLFTSDLVAWSSMSEPQPMPPSAAHEFLVGVPGDSADPSASSFLGTIVRQGENYVLFGSSTSFYQLDHPEVARVYEGMRVVVLGALDGGGRQISMRKIAPVFPTNVVPPQAH